MLLKDDEMEMIIVSGLCVYPTMYRLALKVWVKEIEIEMCTIYIFLYDFAAYLSTVLKQVDYVSYRRI